jgi:hypothetical protein
VLRQDVYISSSKLRFERLPEEEAAAVGKKLFESDRRRGRRGPGYFQFRERQRQLERERATAVSASSPESEAATSPR